MRALSIRQPWAWAIFHALPRKDVENRSRATTHRGPLAIHASKTLTAREYAWAAEAIYRITGSYPPPANELPLGCVLGIVHVLGCTRDSRSPWATKRCAHWELGNTRLLRKTIPMKGRQGFFQVDIEDPNRL